MAKGTITMNSMPGYKKLYGDENSYLLPIYQSKIENGEEQYYFALRPSKFSVFEVELEGEFYVGNTGFESEKVKVANGVYKNTKYFFFKEDLEKCSTIQKRLILKWAIDGECRMPQINTYYRESVCYIFKMGSTHDFADDIYGVVEIGPEFLSHIAKCQSIIKDNELHKVSRFDNLPKFFSEKSLRKNFSNIIDAVNNYEIVLLEKNQINTLDIEPVYMSLICLEISLNQFGWSADLQKSDLHYEYFDFSFENCNNDLSK